MTERTRRHRHLSVVVAALATVVGVAWAPAAGGTVGHPSSRAGVQNGEIAFGLDPGSGERIMTVAPDGRDLRTLVRYRHAAANDPAWSPTGRRLTYAKITDQGCHIILARRDATHRRDLTGGRTGCEQSPVFSPNGRRILFVQQRCDGCRIWIAGMDLTGGHRHRILAVGAQRELGSIALSPDGRRIAFESTNLSRPYRRALLVAGRDGTHLHTLVPGQLDVGVHFDWSATGRWLVYTRWSESPPGHEANVALISPDGSRHRRLTHVDTPGRAAGGATFSPDGRLVVYRFANFDKERYFLCTMRVDGTGRRRLLALDLPPEENAWAPRVG
jgi:Tol biopolymer transport system component